MRYSSLILLIFCLFCASISFAQVYEYKDERGVRHFSSSQKPGYKPAVLPQIQREKMGAPKKTPPLSCASHGGVNCQAGTDGDGSVICYDGFKDAATRFRFTCASPKLEITDISDPKSDGSISVFIRNQTSVMAKKPLLVFKDNSVEKSVEAQGPTSIEPLGIGEFIMKLPTAEGKKPELARFEVKCENCQG